MRFPSAPDPELRRLLSVKGAAATASALHVGIVELESATFERLQIIDFDAIQVKHARLIDENLQIVELVSLVKKPWGIFEGHGVAKPRAAAADHGDPKTCRLRFLGFQNLSHLTHCPFSQLHHCRCSPCVWYRHFHYRVCPRRNQVALNSHRRPSAAERHLPISMLNSPIGCRSNGGRCAS